MHNLDHGKRTLQDIEKLCLLGHQDVERPQLVRIQPLLWSRPNNAASSLCEDKHEYTEHYHHHKKLCDKMRKINFQMRESYVFSQHYFVSLT